MENEKDRQRRAETWAFEEKHDTNREKNLFLYIKIEAKRSR